MRISSNLFDIDTYTKASEFVALRSICERQSLRNFRKAHPCASDEEVGRRWLAELTGTAVDSEGRPAITITNAEQRPDLDAADQKSNKRVGEYLNFISNQLDKQVHEKSLDCTFCGLLFPAYYLLDMLPDGDNDWRGRSYRACYQCTTCQNDDFVWHSDDPRLSPANLFERGSQAGDTVDYSDRDPVAELDADWEKKPKGWHVALITTNEYYGRCAVRSVWDQSLQRWRREPVFHIKHVPVESLTIAQWYQVCQKVNKLRRDAYKDRLQPRAQTWAHMCQEIEEERPGLHKAEIRRQVRLRVLRLTEQLTADILGMPDDQRLEMLRLFRRWDQQRIAKALDPNWSGEHFWSAIASEASLTDWLFKVTDHMDQHFICRHRRKFWETSLLTSVQMGLEPTR